MNSKNYTSFFVHLNKIPSGTAQERKYAWSNNLRKVISYPSKTYKEAKAIYRRCFSFYRPKEPFKAPICLEVMLFYPTKDKKKWDTFKTTKPDGDNLLKVIKDVLNELDYFEDDAHVAMESIVRRWVEPNKGGVKVVIWEK